MDSRNSAQDVTRCDLCEVAVVQMYCDFCNVNLCKPCIGEHISDEYDKHKVVQFKQRNSTLIYPKCTVHQTKSCKFQCKECNISLCSLCSIISDTHKGHNISPLFDIFHSQKRVIRKDINELENIIYPTYKEISTDVETQILNLNKEYSKLTTAVSKHGEKWHKEIDVIVNNLKTEIEGFKTQHMSILSKHLDEIKQKQYLIEETLLSLDEIKESNKVSMTMRYSSKNKELGDLPPKILVSLPKFSPKKIDLEQLYNWTQLSSRVEENGYKLKIPEAPTRELLKEPKLITSINTGYQNFRSITCLSEEEIWTSASDISDIKCFSIKGSLINEIKTKSDEWPLDIAVTDDGDLIYSDWETAMVYKLKNGQTEEMIRLQYWRPLQLCVTSSGDLLVTMYSNEKSQSKVVRYSGSTEKQTIQFDDVGKALYSGNSDLKYISENRNMDICVADNGAGAVVVINQVGKLRFRYTGHPSIAKYESFEPYGITTDSQSQILTADCDNHCIHILDKDGVFLQYLDNCDLKNPFGLFVNENDILFVAEHLSGHIKKIKYLK